MARKSNRTRRDARPRINQAQLQAYRTRKAETIVVPRAAAEPANEHAPVTAAVTTWGRIDEEYAMIASDLKRLLTITAVLLAVIVVLYFVLG